jgi:DNA modification methylase
LKSYLLLEKADHLRPEGIERDTFPPSMVEAFLRRYTLTDELVLDPFAGFGTTLLVAEKLGRCSIGVEWHEDRAAYIGRHIGSSARIVHGDSRVVDELGLPVADFVITSPPYMNRKDTEDPLQGYTVPGTGYDSYLAGLQDIFRRLRNVLKPEGVCVVNVANMKRWDGLTTLAWDVGRALSDVMAFDGEVVVCWQDDENVFGYDHEYCLVFRNA